jgi:hypothetical protein
MYAWMIQYYRDRRCSVSLTAPATMLACLLVVAAISGCGTGVTPQQKAAMTKIQDLGGKINFEGGGYKVDLTGTQIQNKDLEHLKEFANLQELDLRGTQITDAGLAHLEVLTSLQFVRLERTATTREGVKRLKAARPNLDVMR